MVVFQSDWSRFEPPATTHRKHPGSIQVTDYVVIVTIVVIQSLFATSTEPSPPRPATPHSTKMGDRFNIGPEVRELKLGKTFSTQNSKTAFHTLKYDFKPASVDLSKVANVDVSSNNQVTVTVPNLESSGVPNTVFKGNQKKYTKEFVLIFDKETNTMTLEKLNHNILVKKTRSEPPANKNVVAAPPPKTMENNTQRTQSKTRVSTGARKNAIIGFIPRSSPMQQGSPSTTVHKSPQSAPAWHANNGQSTLPSIPLIELDEDVDRTMAPGGSMPNVLHSPMITNNSDYQHHHHHQAQLLASQQHQQQQQHQLHQQQQQQQQLQIQQQQQQQQYHHVNSIQPHNSNYAGSNGSMMMATGSAGTTHAPVHLLDQEIGELSTSDDSSSDSESSGSGSDSDDSDNAQQKDNHHHQNNHQQQPPPHLNQHQQPYANGTALLHDDLQLSESNSSDSDDD